MDEDGNPIIKNTGDINIDTTTYFQDNTQDINDNGEYIYEQNENGAWHLVLKPQGSTEPTDVNIDIPPPTITTPIENNGYYKFNGNNLINGTSSDYNLNVQVNSQIIISQIYVNSLNITGGSNPPYWTFYNSQTTINIDNTNKDCLIITKNYYNYFIQTYYDINSEQITVSANSWVYLSNINNRSFNFMDNNNKIILTTSDNIIGDSTYTSFSINNTIINFSGINWMTFN